MAGEASGENLLKVYESLLLKKKLKGIEDLYFFNKNIVEEDEERRKLIVPHVHGEWVDWFNNTSKRIKLILVPRSCFKTTFFTVGGSLQQIAKDRNSRILIANATLTNAQKMLGEIKSHITSNKTFRELYGEMYDPSIKWNNNEIIVKGRGLGTRESTVTVAGAGGNLVSQHYSTIICDDLVNDMNSATRYLADKIIDWWKRSLSLLDPEGKMLLIGTRWSYYELYSYIMEKHKDEVDIYVRGAYKPDGSLYFPERFNAEKLKELREFHGSYFFSSFYLNDPVDEESALIKKSQIKFYGPDEETKLPTTINIFSVCDPAVSQETSGDFSSITTVGVDWENSWYVLEVRRGHWTTGELITELFAVHQRWKPITMSIEVIGQAQGLMDPIHNEEERLGIFLPMEEIKSRGMTSKEARIRSILQPRFERGKVFIRKDMEELQEELLRFPKSKHDDIIDGLTDVESIGFSPDKDKPPATSGEGYFETKLKEQSKRIVHIDETLGENF